MKFRSFIFGAIALLWIAGLFLTSCADATATSHSSLAGLATLRQMSQQSVPYNIALSDNKPIVLEFYADWCTTCQGMAPILSDFKQQYGRAINFVMLNIDDPQWNKQVQQYKVTGIPHFTVLDSDRTPIQTFVGKVPKSIFAEAFERLAS